MTMSGPINRNTSGIPTGPNLYWNGGGAVGEPPTPPAGPGAAARPPPPARGGRAPPPPAPPPPAPEPQRGAPAERAPPRGSVRPRGREGRLPLRLLLHAWRRGRQVHSCLVVRGRALGDLAPRAEEDVRVEKLTRDGRAGPGVVLSPPLRRDAVAVF